MPNEERDPVPGRAMSAWRERYENLGCVTGILFFGGLVVGMFVSIGLCEVVTITLMHPPGGYFAEGLRYGDSHGRWLTNGEAVPSLLRWLTPPLYLILTYLWFLASLYAITGVARLFTRRSAGS